MRKLWALLKLDFRAMLRAFSVGGGKKRAAGGLGALALMAFIAVYMSAAYSFVLAQLLSSAGLLDLLVPLMAALACCMALLFTVMAAGGFVFGGKDMDLMLSLPVSAFSVMLGKILALYLENFIFYALWLAPTGAAYLLQGGAGGVGFALRLAVCVLFLPLVPTLLALGGGWLTAFASARLRHKALVAGVAGFVLMGAVLVGATQLNRFSALLLENPDGARRLLDTWLLPFGLAGRASAGSLWALAALVAVCAVPFLAVTWAMSTRYKAILSGLSSHMVRSDYRLTAQSGAGAGSAFAALFRKEWGRYFGTSIYLFNTGFGLVLLVGASIWAVFARGQVRLYLAMLGKGDMPLALAAAAVCGLLSTACTTCVSISLEGKTLWILKAAPVPPRVLLGAKAALNIVLGSGAALVCVPLLAVALELTVPGALCLLAASVALNVFVALNGLAVNLLLPKLDAANDTVVVKQSAAALAGMLCGMALVGALAAVYVWGGGSRLGAPLFLLACAALLAAASALLWRWLCTRGAALLRAL